MRSFIEALTFTIVIAKLEVNMMERSNVHWLKPGHEERADIAVLIVSWNVRGLLIENLRTLLNSEGSITAEAIVIDNASKDGTAEAITGEFPWVRVIANHQNLGFAAANNQGIKVMRSRHCVLLNPDMHVEPDALQKTVEYLDTHPDVALVGGRLSAARGNLVKSVRRFPDVWSQLAILLKLPHFFPRLIDRYLWSGFEYEREQSVEVVRGSYFAIHGSALQNLGGLDERYFIWFEEVDYCKHATVKGWKVMYAPWIRATDFVGRSFSQRETYWKQKQFSRSMIQYFFKWQPAWQAMLLRMARPFGLALAWLADRF